MKIVWVVVLIFGGLGLHAQTTLRGKITDIHHHGLYGVSIAIKDSYDGATSDSSGNYSFVTSLKGSHLLEVTATGYQSFSETITLAGGTLQKDIALRESITALKAVVISAGEIIADATVYSVLSEKNVIERANLKETSLSAMAQLYGIEDTAAFLAYAVRCMKGGVRCE